MKKFWISAFFLPLLFLSCKNEISDQVTTSYGDIMGLTEDGIHMYKGIPFAKPPVGDLRWKAPEKPEPWTDIKSCFTYGPSPMQNAPVPFMYWSKEFLIPDEPISEDCLYLNVWSGAITPEEKRPVLVYIYGGGFRSGGSACPIYDGFTTAKKGVVFVTLNYRVGVFGFLAHPELSEESSSGSSGNYALLDMVAGLEWVRDNIAAFGGDPDQVTIAGQSAGAFAIHHLVASPLAKGLFNKAIAQSGGSINQSPLRPTLNLKQAEELGIDFQTRMNCQSLAELRALPADSIQNSGLGLSWPIVDGHFLKESIRETFVGGRQNDVITMVGWNKDDRVTGPPSPASEYRREMNDRFGPLASEFLALYPDSTEEIAARSQIEMGRDEIFGSQDYVWAKVQNQTGKQPVYVYNFNRQVPGKDEASKFGAFHSGEIVYAYDNLYTLDKPWEDADQQLAATMSAYWANFVKTGNPNGEGLPEWPQFDNGSQLAMMLDVDCSSAVLPDRARLELWQTYFEPKTSEANQ